MRDLASLCRRLALIKHSYGSFLVLSLSRRVVIWIGVLFFFFSFLILFCFVCLFLSYFFVGFFFLSTLCVPEFHVRGGCSFGCAVSASCLCLRRFSCITQQSKYLHVGLTDDSKLAVHLNVSVIACLTLCVRSSDLCRVCPPPYPVKADIGSCPQ